jgi:hypothetical protein
LGYVPRAEREFPWLRNSKGGWRGFKAGKRFLLGCWTEAVIRKEEMGARKKGQAVNGRSNLRVICGSQSRGYN